mgnify:FL=1
MSLLPSTGERRLMRHVFVRVYLCKEAKMSLTIYQKIKKGVAFVTTA